jgi:hypothetical protein
MDSEISASRAGDRTTPRGLAYIGLFVTMLAWGLVPAFLKMLLVVFTPTELSFTRFLLSGVILLAWVGVRQPAALRLACKLFFTLTATA